MEGGRWVEGGWKEGGRWKVEGGWKMGEGYLGIESGGAPFYLFCF